MGAKPCLVGMDTRIDGEGIGEDVGTGEAFVHPLSAVLDGHDTADDLAVDGAREGEGFLCGADVLAIGGVVVGHRPIQ